MSELALTSAQGIEKKVLQISGRNVTLVFNKKKDESALSIAKEILTNSYTNSLFTISANKDSSVQGYERDSFSEIKQEDRP